MAEQELSDRAREGLEHLQAAAKELIAAGHALLDAAGELVDDPTVAAQIVGAIDRLVARVDALLGDAARGRMIREGAHVVIAGRPNVGKSSLFNALAGADRAIVTEVPGTTRDLVTERIDIDGIPVTLVDTAGVRDTIDIVEREGVARGDRARAIADVVLVVLDASEPRTEDDDRLLAQAASDRRVIAHNKTDRLSAEELRRQQGLAGDGRDVFVSASTGTGVAALRATIASALTAGESRREPAALSNVRHIALLEAARMSLDAARSAAATAAPEEFVLADLQLARQRFDEVVGRRTTDDLLTHIFERFCIGK